MGPTRMHLSKPVTAAVTGCCATGGLGMAPWRDPRVADETLVFGVFRRRFGVPLIEGGTVRLPPLIGQSHAMDMALTGRAVAADEALRMGLADHVAPAGEAVSRARELAEQLAGQPGTCLRGDRLSVLEQREMAESEAILDEFGQGERALSSGETARGALRFRDGQGRHGGSE